MMMIIMTVEVMAIVTLIHDDDHHDRRGNGHSHLNSNLVIMVSQRRYWVSIVFDTAVGDVVNLRSCTP